MKLSEFNYSLPEELIAQFPLKNRTDSKMLTVDRKTGEIKHSQFADFLDLLVSDDVLVLNNTKVIPARLLGKRLSGGETEIFLLKPLGTMNEPVWHALIKKVKRLKNGEIIKISDGLSVKIRDKEQGIVELLCDKVYENIEKHGKIPLPPYINRDSAQDDIKTYQTVFAQKLGSVAAPTAGLHFNETILKKIQSKGIQIAYITLEVGLGTFMPVKCENVPEHKMHAEKFYISHQAAEIINSRKGNLVAVGTTTTRTLEATMAKYGKIIPTEDETDIFIYPPYEFKIVDKLLTNFHLPKSTLLMLVSAFSSKDTIFKAYKEAIEQKYRFFSYGDCMFLH